jgi:hypothetical protein
MSKNQLSELLRRAKLEKQTGPAAASSTDTPSFSFEACTPCDAAHRISPNIVYVPEFLDAGAASSFAAHIEASAQSWGGWARLHRRSLLNLGGVPHPSGTISEHLPPPLLTLCQRVRDSGALPFTADQCLLNR